MCGIVGFIGLDYSPAVLEAGMCSIEHRGPDASGIFHEPGVGLGHRRLSILDLSELGNQPYHFEHLVLIFNGELYNFKDVRDILVQEGYSFISTSDTEVLIKAFHRWGPECIKRFIGMFAFAIYNRQTQETYLFRDRVGVKPLYYTIGNGIAFASELRGLQPFLTDRTINKDALWEYFRFGYITAGKSIFEKVLKLDPGCYLRFKDNAVTIHRYWSLDNHTVDANKSLGEWKSDLEALMIDAFSLRMVSDVPVGVFLSGGIDSSLVTSILQKHHGNIHTFTIGFNDPRFNEAPYARQVADYVGTNHTEHILEAEQAYSILERFYDVYDEPFADLSGIPTTLVSRIAKEAGVKVVLSADGGDELFAGYGHYQYNLKMRNRLQVLPSFLSQAGGKVLRQIYSSKVVQSVYSGNLEHKVAALGELLQQNDMIGQYRAYLGNQSVDELERLLNHKYKENWPLISSDDSLTKMMLWDFHSFLPDDLLVKMDRATMYNSIEGREPFLDHRLVEMAYQMPTDLKWRNGKSKWILKEILSQYLPTHLFERPKKGFSIPIFSWFSNQMYAMFEQYLTPEQLKKVPVLNAAEVLHEYSKYQYYRKHGKEYNIEKMWRILSFMMWWEKWNTPGK